MEAGFSQIQSHIQRRSDNTLQKCICFIYRISEIVQKLSRYVKCHSVHEKTLANLLINARKRKVIQKSVCKCTKICKIHIFFVNDSQYNIMICDTVLHLSIAQISNICISVPNTYAPLHMRWRTYVRNLGNWHMQYSITYEANAYIYCSDENRFILCTHIAKPCFLISS